MAREVARRSTTGGVLRVDVKNLQTLELDTIADESEPMLLARGAAYAREYAALEDKPTILAMNIAMVLLALRKRYDDWLGRSYPYRQKAAEVYELAGIKDKDQLTRLKGAVRYHVGNLLRDELGPDDLKALELADTSPLERQQERRATDSAILKAANVSAEVAASTPKKVSSTPATSKGKSKAAKEEAVPEQGGGPGAGVKATADHIRLATVAAGLVGQLDTDVIDDHMTDGQRAKLDEQLAAIESAARKLRRYMNKRRSDA
ncbi:hypothetical protein ACFWMJ_23640 [Streptomyces hawaiiensis]|uniref:hypothetical protein n=1 Tax=Streptomyces hawaiiensis TaxID=67305 RepID=UPI003652F547